MGRGPSTEYHKDMMEGYVKGSLTCLNAEYIRKNASIDFPLVLNIEPTNACNLKCYLCPRSSNVRQVGYMDFEFYKQIIDECKRHKKLKMINFHKDGESTLHPRICDMIKYAKQADVAEAFHINTNGVLLEKGLASDFLLSGISDVTISVDAAREETFKNIKGAKLLSKVESNIEGLFKLKKQLKLSKPFIRVKIMEYEDICGAEIKEFVDRWQDIADEVQVTGVHDWSGSIKGLEVTDEVKDERYPCVLLWYMLAINWNGVVSACNVDWNLSAVVGNANEETLQKIWNGKRIKELRQAELSNNHKLAQVCEKCVVWAGGEDMTEWFRNKKEFYK